MADTFATSFEVLNYSGQLFNKGNTKTPFSSMIGGRAKTTNSVEFVVGQSYTSGGGTQPAISETASLTAPDATVTKRAQMTNVTQMFQETVGVSYGKMSNMGTLSGANIANQQANPLNELDFQVAAKMEKVRADMEYTFINGAYNKATTDATINKTRGMLTAITTNKIAMNNKPLGLWDIADGMKKIYEANAPTTDLVGQCICNIDAGGIGGSTKWWTDEMRKQYSDENIMKQSEQRNRMKTNNPMHDHSISAQVGRSKQKAIVVGNKRFDSLSIAATKCAETEKAALRRRFQSVRPAGTRWSASPPA